MENNIIKYITEEDINLILLKCEYPSDVIVENYDVCNASKYMMGFLGDYWKLKIRIAIKNDENIVRKTLNFFIKAISKSNLSKAEVVREMKLFEKELCFYSVIKMNINLPDMKPWSARLITPLNEALVFEDLTSLQYETRNKFTRFDKDHMLQALKTLARFHASSIIFEENKSQRLQRSYKINDEYSHLLDEGGYHKSEPWFIQCMNGALETITAYSKYSTNEKIMNLIKLHWNNVWYSALELSNMSSEYRNVICHRDLWNNNILFHYKKVGETLKPDDCMIVDFQAVRYQPPAGDVMVLLYCNLDPKFREENLNLFLDYYHKELELILIKYGIKIEDVINKEDFLNSAECQRKWGLIVCACLIPQIWIDDELITKIFCDTTQFDKVLTKDKGTFIKHMVKTNQDYRENIMLIFDEIIERYILC
ncbi:uncharacterized protein LOC113520566 [Galleria mellonella]|uniref:Uncharacterized protein LOC113520566 n=1 Tax=Galleria mellonella TaxID=7137 RepID=A0A6J1WZ52_GALME|nr:uncharacterized protein LOC113520566 [Galleria mellonella]